MSNQNIGYIRVSSIDQNPDRQLQDIQIDKKFTDFASGSSTNRPELKACVEYVREGDTLYIDSIDRLARNLRDLQAIVNTIVEKKVVIKFVKENLSFGANQDPLANFTLHMMGAFAEFERTMLKARQKEGIALAKKAGKPLGRPRTLKKADEEKVKAMKEKGISIRRIAMDMKISRPSVYRLLAL